ncbi:MAG: hypothetical protein ACRDID_24315 [Ktedonobacterales bacterium]
MSAEEHIERKTQLDIASDRLAGDLLDDTPAAGRVRTTVLDALKKGPDEDWRVAGVSLYIMVAPGIALGQVAPGASDASDSALFAETPTIAGRKLYRVALPANPSVDAQPDALATEQDIPLSDLPGLLVRMFADAYQREPGLRAGGAQYAIAHIRELRAPATWLAIQRKRDEDGHVSGKQVPWQEQKIARVVTGYLRATLDLFDATPVGGSRGYYEQYDAPTRLTGYIAFGRSASVLGGLSDATLRTFVTLLQSSDMSPQGGLARASFAPTIARIAQWNGTEDVRAIRDQVTEIKRGADAAATGQIWISWALAVIGVALALISYVKPPLYLAPGLACQALSSFFFATYARTARRDVLRIGTTLFWVGIALGVVGIICSALGLPLRR